MTCHPFCPVHGLRGRLHRRRMKRWAELAYINWVRWVLRQHQHWDFESRIRPQLDELFAPKS